MKNKIQENESRGKYFLAAFLAPLIWGFMSIAVRWVKEYPAEDILYYRILTALVLLWLYILIFRKKAIKQDITYYRTLPRSAQRKNIILTILASVFIFGNWGAYIYAINHISIQAAAFAYLVCPLITAVLAFLILKEKLSNSKKMALVLAFVSVILLASGSLTDVLWSIFIATSYALYLIVQRSIQGFDKLNSLAIQLTICSIFVIPKLLLNQHQLPQTSLFWGTTVLIALLFTIIPLFLSMYALTRVSSTTAGVLLYINPLIAFTLAITYFGEQVDPHKFWAYGLILIAILLFNVQSILYKKRSL